MSRWQRAVAERLGLTGSYDPALNLAFYGTGNPNPDYYGDESETATNLYTCSLVGARC